MPITFVGMNALVVGTGAVTPTIHANAVIGDILLGFFRTINGQAQTIPTPNGGTWTEIANVEDAGTGVRGTAFWSRLASGQGNPTTNDAGTINMGTIGVWRGCIASGSPIDAFNSNAQGSVTAASISGLTTTVNNAMVVSCSVCDRDANSTANADSWANADLVSITERFDQLTQTGVGGGFAMADGIKATAGTVGATTWTQAVAGGLANFMIALKPAAALSHELYVPHKLQVARYRP